MIAVATPPKINNCNILSFIKKDNSNDLALSNGYYNFLINISDVQNNITHVKGTILTDTLKNHNLNL